MGYFSFDAMDKELATPRHSTAYGELLTGATIEVGRLAYAAGEGARRHAHPQEQILVILTGRVEVDLDGDVREVGPGEGYLAEPNSPHSLRAIEDTVVLSCKGLVDGVGHRI